MKLPEFLWTILSLSQLHFSVSSLLIHFHNSFLSISLSPSIRSHQNFPRYYFLLIQSLFFLFLSLIHGSLSFVCSSLTGSSLSSTVNPLFSLCCHPLICCLLDLTLITCGNPCCGVTECRIWSCDTRENWMTERGGGEITGCKYWKLGRVERMSQDLERVEKTAQTEVRNEKDQELNGTQNWSAAGMSRAASPSPLSPVYSFTITKNFFHSTKHAWQTSFPPSPPFLLSVRVKGDKQEWPAWDSKRKNHSLIPHSPISIWINWIWFRNLDFSPRSPFKFNARLDWRSN